MDARPHGIGIGLLGLSLLDRARELLLDLADPGVEAILIDLPNHDLPAGLGADLGDSVPHQPAADDAYLAYLHTISFSRGRDGRGA